MREGILELTYFMVKTGKIPSKESIQKEYDRIVPALWENVRCIGEKVFLETGVKSIKSFLFYIKTFSHSDQK